MTDAVISNVHGRAMAILAAVVCAIAATPSLAHHSFSAYDMSKTMTAQGTVKVFRWGAPHSTVVITAKEQGKNVEMAIISGQPAEFVRQGIAPRDIKPGDKITVVYHPNGNGKPGGVMATMTTADGKTYSSGEVAAGGPPSGNGPAGGPPPVNAPAGGGGR
jgi:hypothetical protein